MYNSKLHNIEVVDCLTKICILISFKLATKIYEKNRYENHPRPPPPSPLYYDSYCNSSDGDGLCLKELTRGFTEKGTLRSFALENT